MSFETLVENTEENKAILREICEEFGVEVRANAKTETIIAAIEAEGVEWDLASKFVPVVAEKEEVIKAEKVEAKKNGPQALLRMTRANASYEIRGYRFTAEHPFALVAEEDAEVLTETQPDGFRYATPKEAKEYYG